MEINRAAFGALAIAGIVAAGGGAYIANRPDATASVQQDQAQPVAVPGAVTETENSISTTPAAVPEQAAPFTNSTAAPRTAPAVSNTRPAAARQRTAPPVAAQRPRPTSNPAQTSAPPVPYDPPVSAAIEPLDSTTVETRQAAPEVPQKSYEELSIPADSVIGLQVDTTITSDTAKMEDPVRARVTRDVKVRDQVAIPAGTRVEGAVTMVDRGGRLKDQARLGIRFHTVVLADGTRLPINTETIYRDGESPARESAAKIGGGAVGGAVLGAILGGKKGAIIGSTIGAGAGGAAVAASEANAATLPAGSTVTVRVSSPATVTVEK